MRAPEYSVTVTSAPMNLEELEKAAAKMAHMAQPGQIFALIGDLGAGKTTFAQAFIRALVPQAQVSSPTYTLMQSYETSKGTVWHCDLYRLESVEEVFDIGLFEQIGDDIALIEWPQIVFPHLPPERTIVLEFSQADEGKRDMKIRLLKH